MSKYVSEFIATYTLLLAILLSILISSRPESGGNTLVISSIVAGVGVTILIYGFGKLSGAHMNPAVSTALWLDDQLNTKELFGYIIFQLLGSFLAALTIDLIYSDTNYVMGTTVPSLTEGQAWILEAFLTFGLLMVIFRFTDKTKPALNRLAPAAIGLYVILAIYFAGPYSGASFNPARSFGPAIIEQQSRFHWLFFSAPLVGAACARYFDLIFRPKSPAAAQLKADGE